MEIVVNIKDFKTTYSGKKVFITGHTGFKGTWLSLWLKELGAIIKGYALDPETDHCIFNTTNPYNENESIIADIRDTDRLSAEILSFDPDFIFHLAAQPLVRKSYEIPAETFEVNAIGTANLLEAVHKLQKKCTIIIITTDKVYENKEAGIPYKETDDLGGYDPYSASKACTEIVVSSFRNSFFNTETYTQHQKAVATVRAGNVIGGGDFSKDRIIPDIVNALQQNKEILVRNPDAVRPWQHVLEPLGGYLLLGKKLSEDINYSGAYNFGPEPEDHITVKELVKKAILIWGTGTWKDGSDKSAPHEAGLLQLDISKAKKILNWSPLLSATEAIEWTIRWYQKNTSESLAISIEQINNYMRL